MGENNFRVCEEVKRRAKIASIYALSGYERIEKRSDQ